MDAMRAAVVIAAALLVGPTPPERLEVTGENVRTLYKSFQRLTEAPMQVSRSLSTACIPADPSAFEQELERSGPHAQALVHLYSHGVEASILASRERQFPVGTIVVKEKLAGDTADGVGGMQKMEPGYDPEGGDWLYFYSSGSGRFTTGRLENCRSCHLRAKESDFVYFVSGHDSAHEAR